MAQVETTVKVSIRLLPLADAPHSILHGHYIIHALASKRNVVCTRTIYLPPPLTSQFSTLTCGLVKSTASLAEDAILFHANHIEVTLFISIGTE